MINQILKGQSRENGIEDSYSCLLLVWDLAAATCLIDSYRYNE